MSGSLSGRVVVVTGAGRGIGREHALLFAREGAAVVVNDVGAGTEGSGGDTGPARAVVEEIAALGGRGIANTDDVADSAGAERLVCQAIETYGRLDALVNNAGILRDRTLANMTDDDWDLSIRVNLRGAFAPARAAARHWRERRKAGEDVHAAIVNTSSESGVFANAGQGNYAAAKAGVASLTEVWHKELGRYGVRVNGVLPRARTRLTDTEAIRPRGDRFDIWDPANVSPFVAYLVSETCPISGHLFLVAGNVVQRAAPWTLDPTWKIATDGRWEVDEIAKAVNDHGGPHYGDRDTGLVR